MYLKEYEWFKNKNNNFLKKEQRESTFFSETQPPAIGESPDIVTTEFSAKMPVSKQPIFLQKL